MDFDTSFEGFLSEIEMSSVDSDSLSLCFCCCLCTLLLLAILLKLEAIYHSNAYSLEASVIAFFVAATGP